MQFQKGHSAYFVGIGGIGMSALAQLYHSRGGTVRGSDREPSPTTKMLNDQGIDVYIGHDVQNIPEVFDVLIYSDAVPFSNHERAQARARGIPEYSYFEALGDISKETPTIAIAGSHGKTTTTAMVGHILHEAGIHPTLVVGSIMKDFGSNFVLGAPGAPLVVEACEYNDHLLKLSPSILAVTNLEWDHTDYFKTFEQLKETFKKAVHALPEDGALVVNLETDTGRELASYAPCRVVDYAAVDVPPLRLLGDFNVMNARAAIAVAKTFLPTLDDALARHSVATFQGTWRRFEYKGEMPHGALVYDDYAHHPTEIAVTLKAVREKFPDKKIIVAFHPHLYSRTADFMNDFASALTTAHYVVLAPIYAAREEPIPGVTSEALAEKITLHGTEARVVESLEGVALVLKEYDSKDVVCITMGAGDIYKIITQLLE